MLKFLVFLKEKGNLNSLSYLKEANTRAVMMQNSAWAVG
jgi:hypothetical protein